MAHSLRRQVSWTFVAVEIVLFAAMALLTFFAGITEWKWYWIVLGVAVVLFAIMRSLVELPRVRDILAFEDTAANMARSAMRFGVQRLYNMQQQEDQNERNADTINEITNAESMWLCANSGASYLDPALCRHWTSIEQRLLARVPYKVVLLDPFCREKQLRDQLNVGEGLQDTKINIRNLVQLYNDYQSIEIRFVDRGMHGTVFATPSCLFYDPYHLGVVGQRIENRSFCMKIVPSEPPIGIGYYELLRGHFDSLWDVSQDFEAWIDENAARIDQDLPDLRRRRGT